MGKEQWGTEGREEGGWRAEALKANLRSADLISRALVDTVVLQIESDMLEMVFWEECSSRMSWRGYRRRGD